MLTATSPARVASEFVVPTASGGERRSDLRYPVALAFRYVAAGNTQLISGQGRTLNLSRSGILLETDRALPAGLRIQLRIAWPVRLHGSQELTLWIDGQTVRTQSQSTAVSILTSEFRIQDGVA